jgi:hypothetical protein
LSRGAGLTAVLGANSMNSSAWTGPNANDFYVFGFDVNPGLAAYVDELRFATRSSDRGPGFVNVLYSVDGGAETLITTLTQSGTAFSNNLLNFATPLTVTSSLRILLRSANNTSANGDTVLGAGTLRIGDYSPDAGDTFEPISVSGTVVPEPSSLVLSAAALLAVVLMRWRPRQIAA